MSEMNGSSINYFGSTIQSGYILSQVDEQQRWSYNGIKVILTNSNTNLFQNR